MVFHVRWRGILEETVFAAYSFLRHFGMYAHAGSAP
jgi:hypothetical protein